MRTKSIVAVFVGAAVIAFSFIFQTAILGIYEDIFADQSRKSHLPLRQDIIADNTIQSGDFQFELQLRRPHQLSVFSVTASNTPPICFTGLSGKVSIKDFRKRTLKEIELKEIEALTNKEVDSRQVYVFHYIQVGIFKEAFLEYQNISYTKPEEITSCPDTLTMRFVVAPETYSYIIK